MLTLKLISEETERVIKGLEKKHFPNAREAVEKVLEYDKIRREAQQKLDTNKQQANQFARSRVGICCSSNTSELFDRLEERLRAAIPGLVEVQRSGISPDLLVHTGPDLVGMGAQAVEVG